MFNDLQYAARAFWRTPGFTIVAILTLALGIGASTAVFSVINGVLLRALPYPRSDEILQVWTTSAGEPRSAHAPADFLDLQRENHSLLKLAGYREDALTMVPAGGEPVRFPGALVTVDYFDVFGMPAALGRTFSRAADSATNEPLVVLSHAAWTHQFGADKEIVGTRVRINGVPHTVVGVMPSAFAYPEEARAWVLSSKPVPLPPLDIPGDLLESRGVHYFNAVGRLRPGVTPEQAQADLKSIADDQMKRFPEMNGDRSVSVVRLHEQIVGDVRAALIMMLSAVGIVLLISCANVASLLLARGAGRRRELAIRAALGARRTRLVRQLITESLLLWAAGGAAGLIAGTWAIALLLKVIPEGIPRVQQIGLDLRVAGIAVAVSFASALIFGLIPALQASRVDGALALRDADRATTAGRTQGRTRAALVVGEIALTSILLVCAGLFANSFVRLQNVDPGFRTEDVALVPLPLPQAKYLDGKRQAAFYQRIMEGLQQRPEVRSAAILFPSPMQGANANATFSIEGSTVQARADRPFAALGAVSPDYFRTLGIPLIQGRTFGEQDRDPAPATAIVNAELARKYLAGRNPLGIRVRIGESGNWKTIVGVVGDSRNLGLAEAPTALIYLPYHRFPLPFMAIAIRSSAAPGTIASIVRAEVRSADPDMPVDAIKPLRDVLGESVAEPRFRALLLVAFALMAVTLAAIGEYGLISYSVMQRTREIGIRVALGAGTRQVVLPILREGMTLALAGVAIGLAGSFAASRLLARFLFGVGSTDPLTYAAVTFVLLAVALLASYIPSRRVLSIDPVTALRTD